MKLFRVLLIGVVSHEKCLIENGEHTVLPPAAMQIDEDETNLDNFKNSWLDGQRNGVYGRCLAHALWLAFVRLLLFAAAAAAVETSVKYMDVFK